MQAEHVAFWSQGEFVSVPVNVTYTGKYAIVFTDNTGGLVLSSNLQNLNPDRSDIITIELASTSTYIDLETDLGSLASNGNFVGLSIYPIFQMYSDDYVSLSMEDYIPFVVTKSSGTFASTSFEGNLFIMQPGWDCTRLNLLT